MLTNSDSPAGPATSTDLLRNLRRVGLLDDEQLTRLTLGWGDDLPAREAADRLAQAGLLTPYQTEQAMAGRTRRLRLGPYRILDELGAGGEGRVYKAEHVLMKRLVTLKVFAKSARPSEEVEIVSGLSHPNLCAALHATRLRSRLVLALEYVEGSDLSHVLQQTGPMPVDLAREVIRQAAQALHYLHGQRILHRDVKPANLLLDFDGAAPRVKLIDLGLARRMPCEAEADQQWRGTFDYLAPECCSGEPVDARSDLYSLGCTFYHLLAGEPPFSDGTWASKVVRHRLDAPPRLSAFRPDVPDYLQLVLDRLLAKSPEARYPSASALLADLDPPPAAIPVEEPRRPSRRRLLTALAVAFLGLCAGGAARLAAPAGDSARPTADLIRVAGDDREFIDLQKAVDSAPDGGEVILAGEGPFVTAPVDCKGKSLTFRAADGARPRIGRALDCPPWEALIGGSGNLRLIGLELVGGGESAPLVSVEGGQLTLADCALRSRTPGPLVALRRGRSLRMERTKLGAWAQGVAVEVGEAPSEISLAGCEVRVRDVEGAALLLWSPEPTDSVATVDLQRSEIEAGRILALRALGGRANVSAVSCRLTFSQALAGLDACKHRGDWKRHLRWSGTRNVHATVGPFLRLEGQPLAWDEAAWGKLTAGR